jgi:UDP-GlcNAc:undecaprenyl-phosphate GlcNAc-1-phosphate transferase
MILFWRKISKFYNVYDYPDFYRKIHKTPISLLGGFYITFNFFLLFLAEYFIEQEAQNIFFSKKDFFLLNIGLIFFFILGYFDDKKSINANLKLFLIIIITLSAVYLDKDLKLEILNFSFLSEVIRISYFSLIVTVLCFALFINALNMLDGINCQVATYVIFILIVFITKGALVNLSLLFILFLLIFLVLNYQNKIYLGDSGSLVLGFAISCFFIKTYNIQHSFYADEIFLIMSIAGYELLRLFFSRIFLRKHPFTADQNHIHHLLLKKFTYGKTFLIMQILLSSPYVLFLIFDSFYISFLFSLFLYLYLIKFCKSNDYK